MKGRDLNGLPDQKRAPRWRAVVAELPLLFGLAFGAWNAWRVGWAFVFDHTLNGYRWPDYIAFAWTIELGRPDKYASFRSPLHGGLVHELGERMGSYPDAAVVVSSVAVLAMILGAGLGARALAGPIAGGLAAATLPMCIPVADAARWANIYPLVAGTSALALGLAGCGVRGALAERRDRGVDRWGARPRVGQ